VPPKFFGLLRNNLETAFVPIAIKTNIMTTTSKVKNTLPVANSIFMIYPSSLSEAQGHIRQDEMDDIS
jgi:hypothetical protein